MRKIKAGVLLVGVLLLAGCWTLSLHPLYTEETAIFDDRLIGAWGDTSGARDGTWIFQQGENKTYRLTTKEKDKADGLFEAHLVRLGDMLFLDVYPEDSQKNNEFYSSHLVPAHTIWGITFGPEALTLAPINSDWLSKGLENKTLDIAHIIEDDVVILTAPTEKLQAFIMRHAAAAFEDDPFVLHHKNW
jgi:hypothetical protein